AYPVILAIIGGIVLTVLMVFFVPKFEPIFKKLEEKGELPALTIAVVGFSHALGSWVGLVMFAAAFLGFIGFRVWAATDNGRLRVDAFKLRMPGAGTIFLSLAISRFTRILGTLLHNGIPILQSMRIAKDSSGNRVLANAIEKSAENIKAGDSLAK